MNLKEKRMLEILKKLKLEFDVYGVKAEFEAEGTRKDELMRLAELVYRVELNLVIKIGGCEALSDLQECKNFGANGIVAPMIETPYAMKKYMQIIDRVYTKEEQEDLKIIFNGETITCFENFDEILDVGKGKITNVAIGRVDFSSSMGLERSQINSSEVFEKVKILAQKSKQKNLQVGIGGGIDINAVSFIKNLESNIDSFETRKIIFNNVENRDFNESLKLSTEFEILYLENKRENYGRMYNEDVGRIGMMKERLEKLRL